MAARRRRTAEEAREAILAAAERRFIDAGPESLRLQEIAADVGVAHPTVLHHFGSREELLGSVIERVQGRIYGEVFAALAGTDLSGGALGPLLERVAAVVAENGHARVLYWLALSNMSRVERRPLGKVVDLAQELRVQRSRQRACPAPERDDTRFLVMLATFALTAESVLGRELFGADVDDDDSERFRAWLAALLARHLDHDVSASD